VEKAHTFLNTTYTTWSIGSFQKRSVLPSQRKFLPSEGGGDKKLFYLFIYLALPTRAGSPQQHMPITVGPFCLTHPVNFPCGRKPEYPEETHNFRQSVDFYSFHMRTGFESHWESSHWDLNLRPQRWKASALILIIVNVLGHPKGVGGLTSYFLCGSGMDVFWNDPFLGRG
jgi:hypothetical protein